MRLGQPKGVRELGPYPDVGSIGLMRDSLVCDPCKGPMVWIGETEQWKCPGCNNRKTLIKRVTPEEQAAQLGALVVGPSPIHGSGIFTDSFIPEDGLVGESHAWMRSDGELWRTELGRFYNHSPNPSARSDKTNNTQYNGRSVYANRDLFPGDEITADYREQTDLEQPGRNWNLGTLGSPGGGEFVANRDPAMFAVAGIQMVTGALMLWLTSAKAVQKTKSLNMALVIGGGYLIANGLAETVISIYLTSCPKEKK